MPRLQSNVMAARNTLLASPEGQLPSLTLPILPCSTDYVARSDVWGFGLSNRGSSCDELAYLESGVVSLIKRVHGIRRMSINLMDLVKGAVGSQMGPLAGLLGESEQNTNSAINTAIPAILGGLMKKSSSNEGANQIFKTLDDHDGGILDNLGGLLGGGNHTGLLNQGGGLLDMIFGGNRSSMLGTIARMAGLGEGKIGTLLSVLAPIVMGVIGKQRRSSNLDASGLASMLSSQKDHLAGHMPGELSSSLGLGNLFGDVAGAASGAVSGAAGAVGDAAGTVGDAAAHGVRSAGQAVGNAGQAAGDAGRAAAGAVGDAGKAGGGMLMALLPLILIGALAFLAWKFLMPGAADVAGGAADAVGDVAGAVSDGAGNMAGAVADGVNGIKMPEINIPGFPTAEIGSTFGNLTKSISGIKDEASAKAVLPQFEKAGTMLDGLDLGAIAGGPSKEAVGGMFGGLVEKLKTALETAYAIPGVKGVLEPVVGDLLGKLSAFGV